jgi:hypothetical protein
VLSFSGYNQQHTCWQPHPCSRATGTCGDKAVELSCYCCPRCWVTIQTRCTLTSSLAPLKQTPVLSCGYCFVLMLLCQVLIPVYGSSCLVALVLHRSSSVVGRCVFRLYGLLPLLLRNYTKSLVMYRCVCVWAESAVSAGAAVWVGLWCVCVGG